MSVQRDHYAVLGVSRRVSRRELKDAYRQLAVDCHPDRHPDDDGAEERFKQIQEAYSVLSDPQRRARYDAQRRERGVDQAPATLRPLPARRGEDVTVSAALAPSKLRVGATVVLSVARQVACPACRALGVQGDQRCSRCAGTGLTGSQAHLKIRIPAAAQPGTRLRMAGEGHAGIGGGPAGDLVITLLMQ